MSRKNHHETRNANSLKKNHNFLSSKIIPRIQREQISIIGITAKIFFVAIGRCSEVESIPALDRVKYVRMGTDIFVQDIISVMCVLKLGMNCTGIKNIHMRNIFQ